MGNWELEKIKEFIRGELKKGYDISTIKTSLYKAGFSGSEISKALATFNKKPKEEPGFFTKLFAQKKKEQKKPETKPALKEKPKTTPVKKGPSLFERVFYKEEKPIQKIEPKKETIKPKTHLFEQIFLKPAAPTQPKKPEPAKIELKKPEKPKEPGAMQKFAKKIKNIHAPKIPIKKFFTKVFAKKPKTAKQEKSIIKKPEPVKIETKKPKGPSKIKTFFKKIFTRKAKTPAAKKPEQPKNKIKIKLPKLPNIKGVTAAIFLMLFIAAIASVIIFFPASCATENCFIKKANACGKATYSNIIDGTTFKYETNNCILKKTIIRLADEEPQEIINEFKGKYMYCAFREGDFSPIYLNTITGLLSTCEGDLKKAIQKRVI